MSDERSGFTIRDRPGYVRESLLIETGLSTALDDLVEEAFEAELQLNADGIREQADRIAAAEGPQAARRLLLREAGRLTRWERAIKLGLAGNDNDDPARQTEAMRNHRAKLALSAVVYGFHVGVPVEQLMNEIVAADVLGFPDVRFPAVQALVACYEAAGRPELALSFLARSPATDPAQDLRSVLHAARRAYASGRTGQIADLLEFADWPADPTGLARDLIGRLVAEEEPSPAELAARVSRRGRLMDAGDWAGLRELAISDVMWLEEDATLWRALSAILRVNGATEQADLAGQVSDLVTDEAVPR
jgi:hypothetical protein